jgi:hypothetical protein
VPRRRAGSPGLRVRIEGDRLVTPDGLLLGILLCDEVDLLALEPRRREAAIDALEALLRSLSAELALTVRVRRHRPRVERAGGDPAGLSAAVDLHWQRRLAAAPALHRRVAAAVRHHDVHVLERELRSVATCLVAAGIPARRLAGASLSEHLGDAGLDLHRLAWADQPQQAWVGERLARTAILDRLPGGPVDAGWLAALIRSPVECDIVLHLAPTSSRRATGLLSRRMRHLGAHQLIEIERGLVPDAAVETGLDAARRLRDRLARNAGRPLRLWLTAVALGDDLEALDLAWGQLRGAFGTTLGGCRPGHFEHLGGALAAWGLGPPPGPGKLVDSHAAASCAPWLQTSIEDPDGYRLGRMVDSGLPVSIAPFDEAHHVNANIGIFAASGQGKSFLIGGLLIEARRHGVEAIVVDPEGEYRQLVEHLGGEWLDLVTQAAINPFDLGEDDDTAAAVVVDVCTVLCTGMSEVERAAVEAAARAAQAASRDTGEHARLRQCLGRLDQSAPRVARVLRRFLDGGLAGFLDRPTAAAWTRPLLAIGHREIREELVPVTTLLLGRLLWELVRRAPRRRHIILDEVGMLTAHPALRQLLAQLARRCRKHGSSLVVATQNVQDLLRSDEGSVVASNCSMVLCGGHRAIEVAAMERAFGLTEDQRRRLERAPRGEFLLMAGDRRGMIQVDLPEAYRAMICGGARRPRPAEDGPGEQG